MNALKETELGQDYVDSKMVRSWTKYDAEICCRSRCCSQNWKVLPI